MKYLGIKVMFATSFSKGSGKEVCISEGQIKKCDRMLADDISRGRRIYRCSLYCSSNLSAGWKPYKIKMRKTQLVYKSNHIHFGLIVTSTEGRHEQYLNSFTSKYPLGLIVNTNNHYFRGNK
jgi:hypothetical protein